MPYVGVLKIDLRFADVHDLKAKRKQLASLKNSLTHGFTVSVAEVDHQDLWQRSTLAIAIVAGSEIQLNHLADDVERHISRKPFDAARIERRTMSFSDLDF